ncbi:MAG: hypothetical protein KF729_22560 [Sandaracinaceae bacterium]|nr:hypothetical protein [Sandaracinaceae bacterium]
MTRLAIFVEDGIETGQEPLFKRWLERLPTDHLWVAAPPTFTWVDLEEDDRVESGASEEEDVVDIEAPGCVYIFVPLPDAIDPATDEQALSDARLFISWAADLARAEHLFFSVEYDDEVIGEITPDGPDRGVREAFLEAWARMIQQGPR